MHIYSQEESISDLIKSQMALATVIDIDINDVNDKITKGLLSDIRSKACDECDEDDPRLVEKLSPTESFFNNNGDIAWLPAILASTVWNKNDDVFTPKEMAKGATTPVLKPVNWMHNADVKKNEIIGVINSSILIDDEYNLVSPESVVTDDHKLHIAVGMILWAQMFPTYTKTIQEGLKEKKMFVSMECWVPTFGYALQAPNSNQIILLDRDASTAGLTKYLRWVKGPGKVTINGLEYRIGRWIKNPTFAGVGYVYRPANPESVPLLDSLQLPAASSFKAAASTDFEESGVLLLDSDSKGENMKDDKVMCACNVASIQAELDAAKAALEAAKSEVAKAAADAAEAKMKFEASMKDMEDKAKSAEAKAAEAEAKVVSAQAESTAVATAKAEIEAKYVAMVKVENGRTRVAKIAQFIEVDDPAKAVAEFGEMTEDQFNVALKYATAGASGKPKATDQTITSLPKSTDQTVTSLTKLTDAVAKASDEGDIVESLATAAASTVDETPASIGERLGKKMLETMKRK